MKLVKKCCEYGYNFAEYFQDIIPGGFVSSYFSINIESHSTSGHNKPPYPIIFDVFVGVSSNEVFKYHIHYDFNEITDEEVIQTFLYTSLIHSYDPSTCQKYVYQKEDKTDKLIEEYKNPDNLVSEIMNYLILIKAFPIVYISGVDINILVSSKVLKLCEKFDYSPYVFTKDCFKSNFHPSVLRKSCVGDYGNLNQTIVFERFIYSFYKIDDNTICIEDMFENNKFKNKHIV